MGMQRATCPYCGKFSVEMFHTEANPKRALIHCEHCSKTYYVAYGNGSVRVER